MTILIDPPLWPAHGTLWSHLISDENYDELHRFAAEVPLPRRGFDLDHYDVPARLYERIIELGAVPVGTHEMVHRLRDAGLRVKQVDRSATRPVRRRQYLEAEWADLGQRIGVGRSSLETDDWSRLGVELLHRWNEPQRSYHDERHLEDVLLALNHLGTRGERVCESTLLAAWFHDAVYLGKESDERDSAVLATTELARFTLEPAMRNGVGEMILATRPTDSPLWADPPLAHLLDADLSIFAADRHRYASYTSAVRTEYARVPDPVFSAGRVRILLGYLERPTIYRTQAAQQLWEARARENLAAEIAALSAGVS